MGIYSSKHGCQHQHGGEVERDNGIKVLLLKVVGAMTYQCHQEGRDEDIDNVGQKLSLHDNRDTDSFTIVVVTMRYVISDHSDIVDVVEGEYQRPKISDFVVKEIDLFSNNSSHCEVHVTIL